MIKSVIVDVKQTFDGPVIFLGCEQKMVRQDRKDANSPMVAAAGQWTVELMIRPRGDDGKAGARENIKVTLESATEPCGGLEEFDKVELDGLQYNVMTSERGQAMTFWRLRGIRSAARPSNGALHGQTSIVQ